LFRCPYGTFWHINGTCGEVFKFILRNVLNLFLNNIFPIQVTKFLNGTACAKNIQCDDTKSLTCSPTLYICACPAGYYWDTTTKNCSKKLLLLLFLNLIFFNFFDRLKLKELKELICSTSCTTGNNYQCQDYNGVQCLSSTCSYKTIFFLLKHEVYYLFIDNSLICKTLE
jgi:hypothetical protein